MKIIQLNIWHGKLCYLITDFLNEQQPDIVCMQEVNDLPGGPTYGLFLPLHEIQKHTRLPHLSFAPMFSYHLMNRTSNFGNAILSRFPIRQEKTVFVSGKFTDDFDWTQHNYNIRNLQTCQIETPDGAVTIVNHHGYHVKDPGGDARSIEAMRKTADAVKTLDTPLIFCGDLNVSPESPAMKPLDALNLRNLTVENPVRGLQTSNGASTLSRIHFLKKPVVCDYILTSPEIRVNNFAIPDEIISDHKPLILDFDLD